MQEQFQQVEIELLFETSWEVCNKVGGIYTVLSTKAKNLQTLYKDKVIFVGPDVWSEENPCPVFKESKSLLKKWRNNLSLPYGVNIRVGRWLVPGRPMAILVKFDNLFKFKNDFYREMWENFGVDSLHAYGDYDEACAFSIASAIVIESLVNFAHPENKDRIIAHFDEWTTGMGLLYIKSRLPQVGTIFTTHATSIGRSICGNGKDLYAYFKGYNGDQMARELNMEAKHSLEKAAAHNADCFTTVSEITALECEQLLERRPDVVTPNGFEKNFVPAKSVFDKKRGQARKKLLNIAGALTGAKLPENTFIVTSSGRCEYRNKGLDLFLDSINRLSEIDPKRTTLAFVMVPAWVSGRRKDLRHKLSLNSDEKLPSPFITHDLYNFNEDPVVRHILNIGFSNNPSSRVFIVYVPCYLDGNDGIFQAHYYDLLIGMDATVFPSYYEPWGYTPLESIAFGVPTVTTSLSGFGQWINSIQNDNDISETGVFVAHRDDFSYCNTRDEIAAVLKELNGLSLENRTHVSKAAFATAELAAWDYFIKYYIDAFQIALSNAQKRNNSF